MQSASGRRTWVFHWTRRVLQFNKLLLFCPSNLRQKVGKRALWHHSPNFSKKSVCNEELTSMGSLLTFQRWGRPPWRLAGQCIACRGSAPAESCSEKGALWDNYIWWHDNRFEVNWPPEPTLVLRWISTFFLFGALPSDTLKIKHTKNLKEIHSRHVLENPLEKSKHSCLYTSETHWQFTGILPIYNGRHAKSHNCRL